MQFLPNGIGVSEGGHVLLNRYPLQISGSVWFVDSASGVDGSHGKNAEYPLATLGQAVTNASSGDTIVLRSTHSEVVSSQVTFSSKNLILIGEGRTSSVPSATLTNQVQGSSMLLIPSFSRIINVRFTSYAAVDCTPHLEINGSSYNAHILFCQFEAVSTDVTDTRVYLNAASYPIFEDCVFKSLSTTPATPPVSLMKNYGPITGLTMKRCTFDGGASGFSTGYAVDLSANAMNAIYAEDLSLINGADMGLGSSSYGVVHTSGTGEARVVWWL